VAEAAAAAAGGGLTIKRVGFSREVGAQETGRLWIFTGGGGGRDQAAGWTCGSRGRRRTAPSQVQCNDLLHELSYLLLVEEEREVTV
jgi:hypothetical protein